MCRGSLRVSGKRGRTSVRVRELTAFIGRTPCAPSLSAGAGKNSIYGDDGFCRGEGEFLVPPWWKVDIVSHPPLGRLTGCWLVGFEAG